MSHGIRIFRDISRDDPLRNGRGRSSDQTQRIMRIFRIDEPMRFPTAIHTFHFLTATILVMSSGILVPIATMVRPITVSLIPMIRAKSTAPFTRICPPVKRATIPQRIHRTDLKGESIVSTSPPRGFSERKSYFREKRI